MGYLPGLDGIRALAVLGVLLYHADLPWLPGGYLGVDVFFVLSGFLITSLILEEFDRTGRIAFGRFYLGRARRLLPALLLVLLVVSLAAVLVYRDAARQVASDALASALYVNNWWYIVADQSYFEFIGRPPLLKHLWSLAVEEQFYLIWPAVAAAVMLRWRRRGVAVVSLALALPCSAIAARIAPKPKDSSSGCATTARTRCHDGSASPCSCRLMTTSWLRHRPAVNQRQRSPRDEHPEHGEAHRRDQPEHAEKRHIGG